MICNKCKKEKKQSDFYKRKDSPSGYRKDCKICFSKSVMKNYNKVKNTSKYKETRKKYYDNNINEILDYQENYRKNYPHKIKQVNSNWRENNRDTHRKISRDYYHNNKDKVRIYKRKYFKNKIKMDPVFKLKNNIRRLISLSFSKKGFSKRSKTCKILGCTFDEFFNHLNNNPYGFNVNDSEIQIDHIIPICKAKNVEDVIRLNHYTNLQLLPSVYNQEIKIDKEWDKNHFENWLNRISYETTK